MLVGCVLAVVLGTTAFAQGATKTNITEEKNTIIYHTTSTDKGYTEVGKGNSNQKYSQNKMNFKNGNGSFWAVVDPVMGERKLNVIATTAVQMRDGVNLEPIDFMIYSNYSNYISRWEIEIFNKTNTDLIDVVKVLTGTAVSYGKKITIPANTSLLPDELLENTRLYYKLKVYDVHGNLDETYSRAIDLVGLKTDMKLGKDLIEDRATEIYNKTNLETKNISINGSKVLISGRFLNGDETLYIEGAEVPVTSDGKFVYESNFPTGNHKLDIKVVDKNNHTTSQSINVNVSNDYFFAVGIADITIGDFDITGNGSSALSGDYHYDDSMFKDARLAWYSKSKFGGKYFLTTHLDTRTRELKDVFSDLTERNNDELFRQLDDDYFYSTYGDESTILYDVNSQGKMYLSLEWDKSKVLWGNYNTGFTGTELASYNRSLYGAQVQLASNAATGFGDTKYALNTFVSEPGSLFSHNEFLGTGGSLYYLQNRDIVRGSAKVQIEVRDDISSRATQKITLVSGRDYEIDDIQGRIILLRPLAQIVKTDGNLDIIQDSAQGGNNTYLMVDYEYYNSDSDLDYKAIGVRGKTWLTDNIGIGATYVDEDDPNKTYELKGADLTLKATENTFINLEVAESKGNQTSSNQFSIDGGLSFENIASVMDENETGRAYSADLQLGLSDLSSAFNSGDRLRAWYDKKESNFSGSTNSTNKEEEIYGVALDYRPMANLEFNLKGEESTNYNKIAQTSSKKRELTIGAKYTLNSKLSFSGQVTDWEETPTSGTVQTSTLVGGRIDYRVSEPLNIYGKAQAVVRNSDNYADNNLYTLGADLKLGKKAWMNLEGSTGDRGDAVKATLDYRPYDNYKIYTSYLYDLNNSNRKDTITFGERYEATTKLSMYHENQFVSENIAGNGTTQLYGLDYKYTDNYTLGGSFQYGTLERAVGDTERTSASIYGSYETDKVYISNKLEYRKDDTPTEDIDQWLTTNNAKYVMNEEMTLLGKANLSVTDEDKAKFAEINLGLAYRPIFNDRLNLLAKATYLYDMAAPEQVVSGNDERSYIFSLEGIYRLSHTWDLGSKVGYKMGEVRNGRGVGDWYSNSVSLAAMRLTYHVTNAWDIFGEYHGVFFDEAEQTEHGGLLSVERRISDNLKLGVGYNFTSFNDDLSNLDYEAKGWFINLTGMF